MPRQACRRASRKPPRRYHHGDLRRALLEEAVRTIRAEGVAGLTLRSAGERLGVSRTALYRHFRDKAALLAGVARDGFQRFRRDLVTAWDNGGHNRDGFDEMGLAYVRFAIANPSHYRVMFVEFVDLGGKDGELVADATAAFQVLVAALTTLQQAGAVKPLPPESLAQYIWAMVHGIAMLAINGQLGPDPRAAESLTRFALARLRDAI